MTDEALSPIKRALLEIRELKAQLAKARAGEPARTEIAIVGLGVRLPGGANDAASYADLLWSGKDAIGPIPKERWSLDGLFDEDPDAPGKMITRYGGFLDDVDRFDAEFFGIAPLEAESMDPQQRILLETTWHALEDAGHSPTSLFESRTGVYLGFSNSDYGRALLAHRELIDPYFSTGNAFSVAAGRLSYVLGLRGPAVTIDTACSGSLVAVHLACQGLRLRECDFAIAAASNLILTPEMNISFSKGRMMAPDGRCKTFDAAADGYVRSEGCAVVVLRRLADALADGDRILAVVRGTAVNQDGRSGGLTAPNGPSQEDVIRRALEAADVLPRAIGYVETHGTGTPLGDPIEVRALGAVLGEGRDAANPVVIGSVKTNLGHLEAAAGLAGLVKVVLSLERREIPPNLHFKTGNPFIEWSALPVTVPTKTTPWAPIDGRRLAGVSSFGFSGTNAHLILEEAPPRPAPAPAIERPRHILALSARDDEALRELSASYATSLDGNAADIAFTANAGRAHFSHRLAVTGKTTAELKAGLASSARAAVPAGTKPSVAFLFTGQGAQCAGMGKRLYETNSVFAAALDACAKAAAPHLDRPLLEGMFDPAHAERINTSSWAQPTTFAIEYALATLWRAWGVEPAAVVGHSLGEYAAATVAGVFSLEDGMRLVCERGKIADLLPPGGAMATVFAPIGVVEAELAKSPGVSIGVFNGPEHVVVSGPRPAVEAMLGRLESAGVRVKLLRIPYASHSPHIEPALPAFRKTFEGVTFRAAALAVVSNLTGDFVRGDEMAKVEYWLSHMREPVRFAQSMKKLAERGITHFIEVGPHPVLLGMGAECVSDARAPCDWLPSLHREHEDWDDLLESLQRLYLAGANVDWAAFDRGYARRRVALPGYPFKKTRFWVDAVSEERRASGAPVSAGERWARMTSALDRQAERGPLDLGAASYPAKWALLARITSAHATRVLRDAGLFAAAGEKHALDDVLAKAGIGATYRHLVQRWLERLVGEGLLRAEGDRWTSVKALPEPNLSALWAEAEAAFADNTPLLAYVRHCGDLLGSVITGKESPLETLFPGGSWDLAEGLYRRSTTMRYVNDLAAAAFEALGATTPGGRVLRVLEVGAGTGGTSGSLLEVLPRDRTRYSFTDVSDLFLDRARSVFGAYPFVDFGRFDLDKDLLAQGHAPGSFDVIVSANCVHASSNLRVALERLRSLLAPGGVLVLIESTVHLDWFDMTTGLIEGWQHFQDDLRVDNPLLPPATWVRALGDAGFVTAAAWPPEGSAAGALGQHVVAARAPGEVAEAAAATPIATREDRAPAGAAPAASAVSVRERVLALLPGDRLELLRELVREHVIRVLRLDPANPPSRDVRLLDLGFDSLMAVQLRNALSRELALEKRLPATLLFDHPTIDAIAARLLELIAPPGPRAKAAPTEAVAVQAAAPALGAAAVEAMSDEEVEKLLLQRLEGQR